MQQGHPPYTDDELQFVPYELLAPLNEYLAALSDEDFGQPCLWLDEDTRECLHYDHRPQVCRDFERGGAACVDLRLHYDIE
jgi:uncharacterized protein